MPDTEPFEATQPEEWMPSNVAAGLREDTAKNPPAWARIEGTRKRRGDDPGAPWVLEREFRAFGADGKLLASRQYRDNLTNGISRVFYASGRLRTQTTYLDGKPEGESRGWHENGNIQHEFHWKDRKVVGISRHFHENGQLSSETHHDDGGLTQGWSTSWWPSGREMARRFYRDNRALFSLEFDEQGNVTSVELPINEGHIVVKRPRSEKQRLIYFHGDEDYEIPIELPKPTVE